MCQRSFLLFQRRESRRRARGTCSDARGREGDDTWGHAKERSCDFSAHVWATIGEEKRSWKRRMTDSSCPIVSDRQSLKVPTIYSSFDISLNRWHRSEDSSLLLFILAVRSRRFISPSTSSDKTRGSSGHDVVWWFDREGIFFTREHSNENEKSRSPPRGEKNARMKTMGDVVADPIDENDGTMQPNGASKEFGQRTLRSLKRGLGRLWRRHRGNVSITEYDPSYKVAYLGNVLTGWAKGEWNFYLMKLRLSLRFIYFLILLYKWER